MTASTFHSWLFDSKEAWSKAIGDPRWSYDLPISKFMVIYWEYRDSHPMRTAASPMPIATTLRPASPAPVSVVSKVPEPKVVDQQGQAGQILSQNEIDSLLTSLTK